MTEPQTACWNRLSPWAVVFLLMRGIVEFVRQNLPVVIGAGAWITFVERTGPQQLMAGAGILLLLALLLTLIYHRRFRFRLEDDVLRVQKGLVRQVELKVEASRIQRLTLQQPVWMRPFDIVRLAVDTPGGITTEVELPGIPRVLAEELRAHLSRNPAADATLPEGPATAKPLFTITPSALTLHGLSSNSVYILLAAISPFLRPLEDLIRRQMEEPDVPAWLQSVMQSPALAVSLTLAGLFLLLLTASVLTAWLRYHRFVLNRADGHYVQRSGLLNRREQTLTANRLQSVDHVQTMLGRLLGRHYLVCRQYGGNPAGDQTGANFLIPGLDRNMAGRLIRRFLPPLQPPKAVQPVHRYYRRVFALRILAVGALIGALLALRHGQPAWLAVAGAALLLAWPVAHLRWKAVGWAATPDHLAVRRGLIGRRTTLFPVARVHAVALRQSWFQRRHGVASLQLTLASGPVLIPFIDAALAQRLADWILYRVELDTLSGGVGFGGVSWR